LRAHEGAAEPGANRGGYDPVDTGSEDRRASRNAQFTFNE